MVKVIIKPQNIVVEVDKGTLLIDALRKAIPWFPSPCGGFGICGKCKVKILRGNISSPAANEKLLKIIDEGFRLACLTTVEGDVEVEVPYTKPVIYPIISSIDVKIPIKPWIKWYIGEFKKPLSITSKPADKYLVKNIEASYMDYRALKELKGQAFGRTLTVLSYENIVYRIDHYPHEPLGLAVDLGTTKIAGYLISMVSGETIAEGFVLNPQSKYGDDIISRITAALNSKEVFSDMRKIVIKAIDELAVKLASEAKHPVSDIVAVSIVGNTVMQHILLNLDLGSLAYAPYVPKVSTAVISEGEELGFIVLRRALFYIAPVIAGYVGGDAVATLLTTIYLKPRLPALVVDVGTNAEIGLIFEDKIVVASAPAGPAIEGHITSGTKGINGAIHDVEATITKDRVKFKLRILGNTKPSGISGSGAISLISEMLRIGILSPTGKLLVSHRDYKGVKYVKIAEGRSGPIVFTQLDVRELQKAKSAIQTTWKLMLEDEGLVENDLGSVFIAGSFGSSIKPKHAVRVGLLPKVDLGKIFTLGNAAGAGAKLMLLNEEVRRRGEEIALKAEYRAYASTERFRRLWIKNLNFS